MTVIWEKSTTESSYKITRAGNSIRLYRNQVLHSQWNPISPITGKIWDLFLLSAIGGQQDVKRALVLGAGGGAVINLIHKFYPEANIDAIDLDGMQLYIAKRFFKVRSGKINLIHDNAFDWVTNNIVQRYDLIIDDVFFEKNCVPFRSVSAKKNWVMKLLERLEYDGTLVINFADQKEWKASLHEIKETLIKKKYNVSVGIQNSCDNRIVYISKKPLSASVLKKGFDSKDTRPYLKHWKQGSFSYKQVLSVE